MDQNSCNKTAIIASQKPFIAKQQLLTVRYLQHSFDIPEPQTIIRLNVKAKSFRTENLETVQLEQPRHRDLCNRGMIALL